MRSLVELSKYLSDREIADCLGVSIRTIQGWYNGVKPRPRHRARLDAMLEDRMREEKGLLTELSNGWPEVSDRKWKIEDEWLKVEYGCGSQLRWCALDAWVNGEIETSHPCMVWVRRMIPEHIAEMERRCPLGRDCGEFRLYQMFVDHDGDWWNLNPYPKRVGDLTINDIISGLQKEF